MRNCLLIFVAFSLNSCFNLDLPSHKDLITNLEVLNSPDSSLTLYRYHIDGSMAFTSGSIQVQILPSNKNFDSSGKHSFFFSGNIVTNWTKKDTIDCISLVFTQEPHVFLPFKTEIEKHNNLVFKIDYYYANSSGINTFPLDSYSFKQDSIFFKGIRNAEGKKEAFAVSFPLAQISINIPENKITAERLEQNETELRKDSLSKLQLVSFVSLTSYEFTPSKFNVQEIIRKGMFVKREK